MFPIGIHDIDREILSHVSDNYIFSACIVNKYMRQVCNEIFWKNRFTRIFGYDLGKYADRPYECLYKKLTQLKICNIVIFIKKYY
jgi:hypothetical protein